jgi:hypothetical protein
MLPRSPTSPLEKQTLSAPGRSLERLGADTFFGGSDSADKQIIRAKMICFSAEWIVGESIPHIVRFLARETWIYEERIS